MRSGTAVRFDCGDCGTEFEVAKYRTAYSAGN